MAYNESLVARLHELLDDETDIVEKKMFGGVAFLAAGNMSVGVVKDDLAVRVGPAAEAKALEDPAARPMDFTGRPMKGWLYVSAEGWDDDESLRQWVDRGLSFARSLPSKKK